MEEAADEKSPIFTQCAPIGLFPRDGGLVEMGGIEPPSIAVSLRLLRA
jgi:hypothetical protein